MINCNNLFWVLLMRERKRKGFRKRSTSSRVWKSVEVTKTCSLSCFLHKCPQLELFPGQEADMLGGRKRLTVRMALIQAWGHRASINHIIYIYQPLESSPHYTWLLKPLLHCRIWLRALCLALQYWGLNPQYTIGKRLTLRCIPSP